MEESNKKIEKLMNDLEILQNAYDRDLQNGIEGGQIQENRQNGINKLNEQIKEAEIEKLSKLEERKTEIEEILKKKESLNKDKEQLEQAIYEMSGENEIQDGKIIKSQEQLEYEKDLEKVNDELASLESYEDELYKKELNEINAEIGKIKEKYNINEKENEIHSGYDNIHFIELSDNREIIVYEDLKKFDIEGMTSYLYRWSDPSDGTKCTTVYAKVIYLDKPIDFDMINKDEKYANGVKDFLSPDRIERYSKEAEGKGVVDFLYIGNLQKDSKSEIGYKKRRYIGEDEKNIYNKISKKEYEYESKIKERMENLIENGKAVNKEELERIKSNLESIVNQRPDLYKDNIKDENTNNQQNNNTIEKPNTAEQNYNTTNRPNTVEPNNNTINRQNTVEQNYNTINRPNTAEQNYNTTNKSNTIEQNNQETSVVKYKNENKIVAWIKNRFNGIKEKFNSVKERFSKSKNNREEIELDEVGQAWQDYIDNQEGKTEKTSKTKGFKESLHVKGQQLKQSEIVKELNRQNEIDKKAKQFEAAGKHSEKYGMQQEDDENKISRGNSGVKIQMSNVKVSGNSKILNDMNVKGKSDVDIGIKDTKIDDNARVLNDISTENGKVHLNIENMKYGKDASFMNGIHENNNEENER